MLAALMVCVAAGAAALALVGTVLSRELGGGTEGGVVSAELSGREREACSRPYDDDSPWNTPIGRAAPLDRTGTAGARAIEGPLTSDPTQYTYPVYEVSEDTPREVVEVRNRYSDVGGGGDELEIRDETSVRIPIPADARAAEGSDAQVILVDRSTGDEWGAWQLTRESGGWSMENGYHYNVKWDAVPPGEPGDGDPFGSRGAGVPYLAGLVRPCEIARGRIDHALAFAYDSPSAEHVYPATKSDGKGTGPTALPEGSRLQLDPSLDREALEESGCSGPCLVIARALQRYGMYVIDASGRPKVMMEYEETARWGSAIDADTVSPIPMSAFRLVENESARSKSDR